MDDWFELAVIARIEPPRSSGAVRAYCAKYVAKGGEIDLGGPLSDPGVLDLWPGGLPRRPSSGGKTLPHSRGPPK